MRGVVPDRLTAAVIGDKIRKDLKSERKDLKSERLKIVPLVFFLFVIVSV